MQSKTDIRFSSRLFKKDRIIENEIVKCAIWFLHQARKEKALRYTVVNIKLDPGITIERALYVNVG